MQHITKIDAPYRNLVFDADKVFFTSDLHFGHKNIIEYCHRPYADLDEMERVIIYEWNKVVPKNADTFILGDVFFSISKDKQREILSTLNGRKHLVLGNHDKLDKLYIDGFEHISTMDNIIVCDTDKSTGKKTYTNLVLTHYPLFSWAGILRGTYNLFGHVHNSMPPSEYLLTQMDIGWDVKYTLFRWNEIVESFTIRHLNNDGRPLKGF